MNDLIPYKVLVFLVHNDQDLVDCITSTGQSRSNITHDSNKNLL